MRVEQDFIDKAYTTNCFPYVNKGYKMMTTGIETYRGEILAYCYRLLKNREDAQDVAQEVCLTAFLRKDSLKDPERLRSWAFSIAHNLCLNHQRAQKSSVACDPFEDLDTISAPTPHYREEDVWAAYSVLKNVLTPRRRKVFVLIDVFELSVIETSRKLGMTKIQTKGMIAHSRARLAEIDPILFSGHLRSTWNTNRAFDWKNALRAGNIDYAIALLDDETVAYA